MRISRNKMLMDIAITVSQRGTCLRKRVGSVIAKDGRVLSIGYVGAPSGLPHCTPETCSLETPCLLTIHAEANAVAFAAKEGIRLSGSTMYSTVSPCLNCAKLIINSGIKAIVFLEEYREISPLVLLKSAEIIYMKYHDEPG
jgi:dCMP deaminase